jgi:hypothetical protein
METLLKFRKSITFIVAIGALLIICPRPADLETLKWFGGFIAALGAALFVGQGLADRGKPAE